MLSATSARTPDARLRGTKRLCAETLNHLGYSAAAAADILKDFKRKSNPVDEEDETPQPGGGEDVVLGVDAACEAELLSKLLQRLERKEANPGSGMQVDFA